MNYKGKLFGKIGGKYVELAVDTEFTDKMVKRCIELEEQNMKLKNELERVMYLAIERGEANYRLEIENRKSLELVGTAWDNGFKCGWIRNQSANQNAIKKINFLRENGLKL